MFRKILEFLQPIGIILLISLIIMGLSGIFYPNNLSWHFIRAYIVAFCTGLVFCDIFKHKSWSKGL